ncbi:MAG TPA: HAMP domain-containing protein [Candidatus Avimonoglobus intestinipullorum]|uniref:histidine kinase n=1 Tax=Candidatus Avimonoglobus intestinipullorum TaxID=2840699 RepID=A0A9D1LWN5_9FIRM|nr:HAMP domain-containing protein [Candidatus Avimonoglobus intestinipullorum]
MFKSIQSKIVLIFVLLILSIIIVIGSFLLVNIVNFYNSEFSVMMEQVFTDDFVYQMEQSAQAEDGLEQLSKTISTYIGPLGIDTYRFYCILDGQTGAVLVTSDSVRSQNLDISDNIITAMAGRRGNMVNTEKSYMDYSVPLEVNGQTAYILYVKDTKEELTSITHSVLVIILQALLLAVLITFVIGYLLSRTITVPIINLTKRAEHLAAGDFESIAPSAANDEIGRLNNTFRHMAATLHDSMEDVNAEKTKVETILQNMTDGILAFNLDGSLLHINPEAQHMIDRTYIADLTFDSFFKEINADIAIGDLLYLQQDQPEERQVQLNGRILRLSFAAINSDNRAAGILVVMHDITAQEKLELSRREFVANVSHELRTPLTTVKSYAETLMNISDVPLKNRFLNVIITETDRMTRIVKDLLVLTKLDEGHFDPKLPEKVDIRQFLEELIDKMQLTAQRKEQTLHYKMLNETPVIETNRDKLEQVVLNILSNALKYTPKGGTIEVFSGRLYQEVYIKITDTGIGIPAENLPRIFERFYRVDKARSRETGGTGLGLAIAKQLTEELGGRIAISSAVNVGTEVVISLPVSQC